MWLHELGYQFVGPTRIGDLTPDELAVLQFGWVVRQEQQQQEAEGSRRTRKYSRPNRTTSEALSDWNDRVQSPEHN